jgi:UDP-glucose 4-epimerase
MNKLQKILVTGGAGFIGSHLTEKLLGKGYSVVVLDNMTTGNPENLKPFSSLAGFELKKGDIRDRLAIAEALCGTDAVVHLAALIDVEKSVLDPAPTHEVNATGTLNVLQEAVRQGVKRFVLASSAAVYGDTEKLPIKEDTPLKPLSPYAASKTSAEAYCQAFAKSYALNTIILRPFNVYGPRSANSPYSGVITKLLKAAASNDTFTIHGDGRQTRDFIHVNDVAQAITLALETQKTTAETLNVCTGKPVSINELVQATEKATEKTLKTKHGPPRKGDIKHSYGDPAKAAEQLKFKATTTLQQGLNQLT